MEKAFDFAKLLPLLIPIILIQLALMVASIIDLVRQPKARWLPKWAWVLVIVFVNIVGPIIYLIFGRKEE